MLRSVKELKAKLSQNKPQHSNSEREDDADAKTDLIKNQGRLV